MYIKDCFYLIKNLSKKKKTDHLISANAICNTKMKKSINTKNLLSLLAIKKILFLINSFY